MRAVLYARFSETDAERAKKTETLDLQLEQGRAYCLSQDYRIEAEEVDREKSGKQAKNRPGLQAAIEAACKLKAVLVVRSLSRLARNTREALEIAERLHKAKAHLASVTESIDTYTPTGYCVFTILSALAQLQREQTSAAVKEAHQRYQSRGKRMSRKDRPPYGWRFDENDQMIQVEEEQEILMDMLAMHGDGHGSCYIARQLNQAGLTCRGNRWHPWTIEKILRRETSPARIDPDQQL
jgi:DNA invertase Pin-like site-specific DNA recombinase